MPPLVDRPEIAARRERLLELLRTHAFEEREVVLSSGRTSNFYIDCKQVSLDAEGAMLIGELFHPVIEEIAPAAGAGAAAARGGERARRRARSAAGRWGQIPWRPRPRW